MVVSIARPGGKVTGASCISSDLAGNNSRCLRNSFPRWPVLRVFYNPGDRNKAFEKEVEVAARSMKSDATGLQSEFTKRDRCGLCENGKRPGTGPHDSCQLFMNRHIQKLADLSLKNRLPAIYGFPEFANAGGLLSYGASNDWLFRRTASSVDKIFKGANPGDLPIEQPTTFEFLINRKTAKALDLTIPPSLIATADEVIE